MVTAIVLICTVELPILCYHSVYPDMLTTTEECDTLITQYHAENRFTTVVENKLFTLSDYQCIDWNAKRI
jgi:hypothetical protein